MRERTEKRAGKQFGTALFLYLIMGILLICMPAAAGCGTAEQKEIKEDGRLKVVTTLFPYYDFLRQIAGDEIHLTLVVPAGMDSHSFEPTPADMITIQNADILVCNGGALEHWVEQVLSSFEEGEGPERIITMMDYVDTVQEEIVEGMEHSHGHDASSCTIEEHGHDHDAETCEIEEHGHDHDAETCEIEEHNHGPKYVDDGHGHEIEYDEHIWTSPVNAMELTAVLAEVLAEEEPVNAELYHKNAELFTEQLKEVDAEFRRLITGAERRMIVFGDKFPLRYFFDEYGLEYRAAFSGCSSDTEPSAKTIAYLIDKVRQEEIPAIYYLELSSPRVAEIIGEETGAEPLLFHTCHNLTRRQFDSGVTYIDLMKENLVNIRKGLY